MIRNKKETCELNARMNTMKQISEVAEENAAVQNNMKTNDDDYNMVSSTT